MRSPRECGCGFPYLRAVRFAEKMSEIADALRGNKLEEVHSRADRRAVAITASGTIFFSVDGGSDSCVDRLLARVR